MRRSPIAILVVAAAALVPALARAEGPTPAEAGRKALATFAAPSEKHAFAVDLELYLRGGRLGGGALSAAPEKTGEGTSWRATEAIRMGTEAMPYVAYTESALLSGDLRVAEQTRKETNSQGTRTTRAVRTEKGLHVTYTVGETVKESDVAAAAETISGGVAAVALFLRQAPAEAAEYEFTAWDGEARTVETLRISVKGLDRMKDALPGLDVEALRAVVSGAKEGYEVYVDPKDRSVLGMRVPRLEFWLLRKGLAPATDAAGAIDPKKPADSAIGVGRKLLLGALTSDGAAMEASFHWPSMAANRAASGTVVDEASVKSSVLSQMQLAKSNLDAETARGIVTMATQGAEEKALEGGAVLVRFAPPMDKISYTARRFEGSGWLITDMDREGEK
jgi:hypothetical protein